MRSRVSKDKIYHHMLSQFSTDTTKPLFFQHRIFYELRSLSYLPMLEKSEIMNLMGTINAENGKLWQLKASWDL